MCYFFLIEIKGSVLLLQVMTKAWRKALSRHNLANLVRTTLFILDLRRRPKKTYFCQYLSNWPRTNANMLKFKKKNGVNLAVASTNFETCGFALVFSFLCSNSQPVKTSLFLNIGELVRWQKMKLRQKMLTEQKHLIVLSYLMAVSFVPFAMTF